ncbi:hypothetical protein ABH935_000670 [Catenulispora sp. GAS73]|uniref:hypothetical protein n=1 Tax=Catenulispora sp. GAS73 TaxID=3156269 RepID=UPI00351550B3
MLSASHEGSLIESFDAARLADHRRALLRRILLAIQPIAHLSWHAASANASVLAVAHARAVLHARTLPPRGGGQHQPYARLAFKIQESASAAIDSLIDSRQPPAGIIATRNVFTDIFRGGEQGLNDLRACAAFAARLDAAAPGLTTAVETIFEELWDRGGAPRSLERIAVEIGALSIQRGRTHDHAKVDLESTIRRGNITAPEILQALYSQDRRYRATVVVDGTHKLIALDALMGVDTDVHQFPLAAAPSGPGHRMPQLLQFVQQALSERRGAPSVQAASSDGAVVLSFHVVAPDLGAAAVRARRRIIEVLDQYVAGNRLSDLRLGPESMVFSHDSQTCARFSTHGPRRDSVRPLTTHWPLEIRESLRSSHIARTTEAPMARAGLSWVALESFGLKATNVETLANALSLVALRQQLVGTHDGLRNTVKGALLAAERRNKRAARTLRKLERYAIKAQLAKSVKADTVAKKVLAARTELSASETFLADLRGECVQPLSDLDAYCALTDWFWLDDVNRWLELMEPLPRAPHAALTAAHAAVSSLCGTIGGLAAAEIIAWRGRLASLSETADWLEECQGRFKAMLNWLYTIRNLALHTGSFESESDELDAHGACALVDMTLEFLGNWYQAAAAHDPAKAGWSAMQIVDELSVRQQNLIKELKGATSSHLNAQYLTSPTSSGWDR